MFITPPLCFFYPLSFFSFLQISTFQYVTFHFSFYCFIFFSLCQMNICVVGVQITYSTQMNIGAWVGRHLCPDMHMYPEIVTGASFSITFALPLLAENFP